MHPTTFHGLHEWHKHMFEKLGWMVLAKAHGRHTKIAAYLEGIEHLLKTLNETKFEEADRNRDIAILKGNVEKLQVAAKQLLGKTGSSQHEQHHHSRKLTKRSSTSSSSA